jgi:hypothetical protein
LKPSHSREVQPANGTEFQPCESAIATAVSAAKFASQTGLTVRRVNPACHVRLCHGQASGDSPANVILPESPVNVSASNRLPPAGSAGMSASESTSERSHGPRRNPGFGAPRPAGWLQGSLHPAEYRRVELGKVCSPSGVAQRPAEYRAASKTGTGKGRGETGPNAALQRNPARGSMVSRHRRAPGPLNLDVRPWIPTRIRA